MGKLETDTDSQDYQYEEIGLDPLRTNGSNGGANAINIEGSSDTKSKSSASPSSTSSSLGRKKWSLHKSNGKVDSTLPNNEGVYRAKEFDAWAGGGGGGKQV